MLGALLLLALPELAVAADRPNILFVYLDDFGWRDAGFMGSDFYETPHLDALAAGGLVFTDAYSCAANCAPARACLLSGQYTPRHEVFNVGTRPRGAEQDRLLTHVPGTATLRPDIVTWAESLQAVGYRTGLFGKWHLGTSPGEQGFDVAVDHRLPGFEGHRGPDGAYLTDVLTDRCLEFIEANRDERWCAYLSHFAVHTPLHAKRELLPKYREKAPGELHDHVEMATMIQAVDDGVGRLVAKLEALELLDETVILFSSDNGGYGPATDMDPLYGYKGTYYEGGIRVPFFVHWPGVVAAGETEVPITGVDVYPTLLAIAGAERPGQVLDGRDLTPLLRGGEVAGLEERPLFWHFPAYLQSYKVTDEQRDPLFRTRPCSVVRRGRYKLHEYFEDGSLELYDLVDDVRERKNLAGEEPEKRDELHRLLREWREDVDAPVPERKPAFTHGPMLGAVTPTSAVVWARASRAGAARLHLFDGERSLRALVATADPATDLCVRWTIEGLTPARTYPYTISLADEGSDDVFELRTAPPAEDAGRVRIAFGSCADERRFPRQPIWTRIAESGAEAMVLLGDTPYIDSTELDVQRRRYREFYSIPELALLLLRIPFYSTWDDHDFGRNDTNGRLPNKDRSLRAFREYHPNPSFGQDGVGIYTSFRRGPIEVFLLDTRWFATTGPSPFDADEPTLLGAAQWDWLKAGLEESTAPFKVLACGMIWNEATRPLKTDHWGQYPHERSALFRFIGEQSITGVVLVGGDIHRSRVVRHDTGETAGYPLTELISSPLANTVIELANAPHPGLVKDMGVDQTFLLLTADSTIDPAVLDARFVDSEGASLHELRLTTDELKQR